MREKRTIIIDGQRYDAATGMPAHSVRSMHVPQRQRSIDGMTARRSQKQHPDPVVQPITHKESTATARQHTPSTHMHSPLQRSQTLHRAPLKKPDAKHAGESKRERAIVAKSPHITKFAAHKPEHRAAPPTPEAAPRPHPIATKLAQKKHAAAKNSTPISSRAVKEHLIKEQIEKADTQRQYTDHPTAKKHGKGRFASVATAGLALVLLGGYLTYLNMPGLSIRVAAVQAGIDASLPGYHPDGYRFNGPITFSNGEVELSYRANGGPQAYSVTQKSSDWDSQAVLDNYILQESDGSYNIHSTQGLTVYTYNDKAVWVNRGILHEVDYGEAPLSNEQIERIAASM